MRALGIHELTNKYSIPTSLASKLFMANKNNPLFVTLVTNSLDMLELDLDFVII
jgi:hypothetical protein